jgi:hypothetical protein
MIEDTGRVSVGTLDQVTTIKADDRRYGTAWQLGADPVGRVSVGGKGKRHASEEELACRFWGQSWGCFNRLC